MVVITQCPTKHLAGRTAGSAQHRNTAMRATNVLSVVALRLSAAMLIALPGAAAFAATPGPPTELIFFGSGEARIFAARLDPLNGRLFSLRTVAATDGPNAIVSSPHAPIIYVAAKEAVSRGGHASVRSFAVDPSTGTLAQLSVVEAGAGRPVSLLDDPQSHSLFVVDELGGVVVLPIAKGGLLQPGASSAPAPDIAQGQGRGGTGLPGVVLDPTGGYLFIPDFAADRVLVRRFDPKSRSIAAGIDHFATLPSGSGPRRILFHPDGHMLFVDGERTGLVSSFAWDSALGRLHPLTAVPTSKRRSARKSDGMAMAMGPDKSHLYVASSADDMLSEYAIDPMTGGLSLLQRVSAGGKYPESLALDPSGRWLIVANTRSGTISMFAVDSATGALSRTARLLRVARPSSIAFSPGS